MVKTKCLYDAAEPTDGDRILVTRHWPRGISKIQLKLTDWVKDLAPSRALLADWKKGEITWPEYVSRYKGEMSHQIERICLLADRARHNVITLLCFEREGDPHCHRYALKEMIEQSFSD